MCVLGLIWMAGCVKMCGGRAASDMRRVCWLAAVSVKHLCTSVVVVMVCVVLLSVE